MTFRSTLLLFVVATGSMQYHEKSSRNINKKAQAGFLTSTEILPYVITLPAKKWHWRARTSALYLSQIIPESHSFKNIIKFVKSTDQYLNTMLGNWQWNHADDEGKSSWRLAVDNSDIIMHLVVFCSSVLNLAELIALRPDLSALKKIVYFHENQLVYPVRKAKERDFQYGYNQILTCLVADVVLFNSKYNQESFLSSINKFLKLQPDYRAQNLEAKIVCKCEVLYFPLSFPYLEKGHEANNGGPLHIVWAHRWEHDKDPDTFFRILFSLKEAGHVFQVSVLGESYSEVPAVFSEAHSRLSNLIVSWGHLDSKEKYYATLTQSHVAVSTAKHEFYGIAMLEAAYCGCLPLCPKALVYPELYPEECLYDNESQLKEMLVNFCKNPQLAREMRQKLQMDFKKFSTESLIYKYNNILTP